ncbi:MAG: chorismate synthase, partial [Mailhella sp.]|nr:chorismate synthase [Mailhella sp.]
MNTIGRKFRVSIFGESHGELIGVVMDGVPAGLELSEQDFEQDILRRKSGAKGTTPRLENDKPMIVSGTYEGHTTGAPLTVVFRNSNVHSLDYALFEAMPRPGHADLVAALKWDDCQDPRGGGHFSGRLTLPVVAAGVVAKKILSDATILDDTPFTGVNARIIELGGCPSEARWQELIDKAIAEGDSLGAVIECTVPDIEPGYGEPFWDSVESQIAHAVFAIPGVRAIEFGDGFKAAAMKGSEHNDPIGPDGR